MKWWHPDCLPFTFDNCLYNRYLYMNFRVGGLFFRSSPFRLLGIPKAPKRFSTNLLRHHDKSIINNSDNTTHCKISRSIICCHCWTQCPCWVKSQKLQRQLRRGWFHSVILPTSQIFCIIDMYVGRCLVFAWIYAVEPRKWHFEMFIKGYLI